jgi:hypothetical protein
MKFSNQVVVAAVGTMAGSFTGVTAFQIAPTTPHFATPTTPTTASTTTRTATTRIPFTGTPSTTIRRRRNFITRSTVDHTEDVAATTATTTVTKKNERLRMMKKDTFHRNGFKEVRGQVEEAMAQQFKGSIVDELKSSNYVMEKNGVKVYLAKVSSQIQYNYSTIPKQDSEMQQLLNVATFITMLFVFHHGSRPESLSHTCSILLS